MSGKKLFALLLVLALGVSLCPAALAEECLTCGTGDAPVESGQPVAQPNGPAWYAAAQDYAMQYGLLDGIPGGFQANVMVSRADVVATLHALAGRPAAKAASTFSDVGGAAWYAAAVAWAQETGVAKGNGANAFMPMNFVTRAELSTLLERYLNATGRVSMPGSLAVFRDAAQVPSWAQSGMETCVSYQLVRGNTNNELAPQNQCSWAELVTILQRVGVQSGVAQTTTPTEPTDPVTTPEPETPAVLAGLEGRRSTSRAAYSSDAVFANYREVRVGDIAPGILYRSASPIDPAEGRNAVADAILAESAVKTIVNLADCRFRYQDYPGYADTSYSTRNIVSLNMGTEFLSDAFSEDMKNGLEFILEQPGPYLLHGGLGVTRTGFVFAVLEALMGATREEIVADYMRSYENVYFVDPATEEWQEIADVTVIRDLLSLTGGADAASLETADLAQAAQRYLIGTVGMSAEQVVALKAKLSTAP